MGCPVILTPQSQEDLCEIVSRIAGDDPKRARSFGYELIDHALAVGKFPEIGRMVPELNEFAVREVIHGSYRIIYEIFRDPNAVYVLRFWHAARGKPKVQRM
jgi:toxin ParE1/3/4